jgi:ABC-2 type transport system ATP-binding protein
MLMMTTIGAASAPHTTGEGRRAPGKVVLRTHALTKRFDAVLAVDGLDIDVRAGEVLGFLGPNGSGKSTTVGMILGLIEPTAGKIEFYGQDLARFRNSDAVNRSIGAIIETPAFYPYLSGRDNLRALAIAAGGVPDARIDELIEMVGLTERTQSAFKTYSLGMKQRLGIASTLLTDPDLVILDEPTNGLDPAGQREVRELIPRLAREGRAVLLASHLLNEVEQVCDRVAIIRRGKLLQFGSVADLLRRGAFIEVVLPLPELERAAAILRDLPFVGRVAVDNSRLQVIAHEEHGREINRALANAGLYAAAIVPRKSRLEDVFLEMTEDETPRDERGAVDDAAAA